ncbi:hypothetical protein BSIN_0799 [Burkholderia singularis]|uniref:Uncharacterized protein n=1 Tax=Burkholderia singularis TaxID=1503053 RepID=A0A238H970_9BURK|nr:hypothetical protein BSIN_0799 [Burkholderia singularis]
MAGRPAAHAPPCEGALDAGERACTVRMALNRCGPMRARSAHGGSSRAHATQAGLHR